jgi:hypothetical protein
MALRNRVVCRRPDGYWVQQRLEGAAEAAGRRGGEEGGIHQGPVKSELPAREASSPQLR